jgi:hypothetical protein
VIAGYTLECFNKQSTRRKEATINVGDGRIGNGLVAVDSQQQQQSNDSYNNPTQANIIIK